MIKILYLSGDIKTFFFSGATMNVIIEGETYENSYNFLRPCIRLDNELVTLEDKGKTLHISQKEGIPMVQLTVPNHLAYKFVTEVTEGNIHIQGIHSSGLHLRSNCGNIVVHSSTLTKAIMDVKNGDITLQISEVEKMNLQSTGGEVKLEEMRIADAIIKATSKDVQLRKNIIQQLKMISTSGSFLIEDSTIEKLNMSATSGISYLKSVQGLDFQGTSTSGDYLLETCDFIDTNVATTSGDIALIMNSQKNQDSTRHPKSLELKSGTGSIVFKAK